MQNKSNSIESVLADLVQKYGGAELYKKENARKLNGLLKDMAGDFPDELRLLTRVVPDGFQEILFKANEGSLEEKKGAVTECKMRLVDVSFLSQEKAEEAANIFAAGLEWKLEEGAQKSKEFGDFSDLFGTSGSEFSDIFDSIFGKKASDISASTKTEGIVVGKNSDFHTLGEAVKAAKNGDSIKVLPGLYIEPEDSPLTEISKKITITGCKENIAYKAFSELPVIVLSSKKSCKITADVTIEGIVFTSDKDISFKTLNDFITNPPEWNFNTTWSNYEQIDGQNFRSLLWVESYAFLKNIALLRDPNYGITFSAGKADLSDSIIAQCSLNGIYCVNKEVEAYINNCKICHCNYGIYGSNCEKLNVNNSEIYKNLQDGFYVHLIGGDCNNCAIHDNGGHGFNMYNGSYHLSECCIFNNASCGISCKDSDSNLEIVNCKVYGHNATYDMYGDVCGYQGIDIFGLGVGSGKVKVLSCEVYDNSAEGIFVGGFASSLIENCSVHNNKGEGIHICGAGKKSVTNCTIFNNQKGGVDANAGIHGGANYKELYEIKNCNIYSNGE